MAIPTTYIQYMSQVEDLLYYAAVFIVIHVVATTRGFTYLKTIFLTAAVISYN